MLYHKFERMNDGTPSQADMEKASETVGGTEAMLHHLRMDIGRKRREHRRLSRMQRRADRRHRREDRRLARLERKDQKLEDLNAHVVEHHNALGLDTPEAHHEEPHEAAASLPTPELTDQDKEDLLSLLNDNDSAPAALGASEEVEALSLPRQTAKTILTQSEARTVAVDNYQIEKKHPYFEFLAGILNGVFEAYRFKNSDKQAGVQELWQDSKPPQRLGAFGINGEFLTYNPETKQWEDDPELDRAQKEGDETLNEADFLHKKRLGVISQWLENANPDEVKQLAQSIANDQDAVVDEAGLWNRDRQVEYGIPKMQKAFYAHPEKYSHKLSADFFHYILHESPKAKADHNDRMQEVLKQVDQLAKAENWLKIGEIIHIFDPSIDPQELEDVKIVEGLVLEWFQVRDNPKTANKIEGFIDDPGSFGFAQSREALEALSLPYKKPEAVKVPDAPKE